MLWVGGGQGAGKTTLSWRLSRANDLPLHTVDLSAYDHQARLPAGDSLEEQLARGPEAAAAAFESASRLRLELVLDDILARDLDEVPAIVEGPQLMPGFADRLPPGRAVWLVPDPARTRLVREGRLAKEGALAGGTAAGRSRLHRILQRDGLIAERIRASAALSDRPVIEVPLSPDWAAMAAAVESALALALRSAPRLAPGSGLRRQRRHENRAAVRQGRLWMRDAGLTVMPPYPFGCECGTSRCHATWMATPDAYAARTASERPLIAHGTSTETTPLIGRLGSFPMTLLWVGSPESYRRSGMKVLLISGSTRSGSANTAALVTAAALAPVGVTTVLYDGLGILPAFNPDHDGDRVPEPVAELRREIEGADAVLFCTPEYAGTLPGSLKNLLDWMVGGGELYEKAGAWVNVAAANRGQGAQGTLAAVLGYVGAVVIESACRHIPVDRSAIGSDGLVSDPRFGTGIAEVWTGLVRDAGQAVRT